MRVFCFKMKNNVAFPFKLENYALESKLSIYGY